jgi:hypothetical protein
VALDSTISSATTGRFGDRVIIAAMAGRQRNQLARAWQVNVAGPYLAGDPVGTIRP